MEYLKEFFVVCVCVCMYVCTCMCVCVKVYVPFPHSLPSSLPPSFSLTKHHCRKCGAVVCGTCSNRRFLLPYQAERPLRVCISCYEALTTAHAESDRYTCTRAHIHASTCTHTCVYTHMQVHVHTHTHTHKAKAKCFAAA